MKGSQSSIGRAMPSIIIIIIPTAESMTQKWPVSDVVDLDDMTFDPDQGSYKSPCRCGGCYTVSNDDLEGGVEVVCCSACSLSIRILYQELTEGD